LEILIFLSGVYKLKKLGKKVFIGQKHPIQPPLRWTKTRVMFVSWKVVSGKSLSKLSCICLLLEKTVNGKHFPVKGKFYLVSRKVFFFLAVFIFRKVVFGKPLSKLSCVCLPLKKLINEKHFQVKGKFSLDFRKVFSWKIWAENTFRKLWKI